MDIENYKYTRSVFVQHGEKLKFKMGQSISDNKYLSGSVYFIEEGSARIIYKEDNKFKTITKISKGSCVGAISLIRSAACENIRASTELLAYKISDKEFKSLYNNDLKFKEFFNSNICESEVIDLADYLSKNPSNKENSLSDWFSELKNSFHTIFCNSEEIIDLIKINNRKIYLAQKLEGFDLYSLIIIQIKLITFSKILMIKKRFALFRLSMNLIKKL